MYQLLFVTWMSTNQFYRQIFYVICSVYLIPHYLTKADQFIWETLVNCAHSSLSNSVPCSWTGVYHPRQITTWPMPWGMETFSSRYGFNEASMMWCLIGIIPVILRRPPVPFSSMSPALMGALDTTYLRHCWDDDKYNLLYTYQKRSLKL